jgi:hypothetical protein
MNLLRVAVLCLSVAVLPAVAGAQAVNFSEPAEAAVSDAAAQALPGPRIENERLGVAPAVSAAERADAAGAAQPRMGEPMAMMIVGGAALVAGLIIGGGPGTVLALGGAVIGLVGLYQYLR